MEASLVSRLETRTAWMRTMTLIRCPTINHRRRRTCDPVFAFSLRKIHQHLPRDAPHTHLPSSATEAKRSSSASWRASSHQQLNIPTLKGRVAKCGGSSRCTQRRGPTSEWINLHRAVQLCHVSFLFSFSTQHNTHHIESPWRGMKTLRGMLLHN